MRACVRVCDADRGACLCQVVCLSLDRDDFTRLMGPMQELLSKNVFRQVFMGQTVARNMTEYEVDAVVNAVSVVMYEPGQAILHAGGVETKFVVLKEGTADAKLAPDMSINMPAGT